MAGSHQSPFARRLLGGMLRARALAEHGDARARTSPMWPHWTDNLHPALRSEAVRREAAGQLPLHSHAHALNSSQAFAMNLFLPLTVGQPEAVGDWLSERLGRGVRLTGVDLEYFGSGDVLAEIPGPQPGPHDKLTAADVALHLRDDSGRTCLLLVEVKLGEQGFTPCGGATSRGNRDLAPCDHAATFFAQPHRCYLRRPWRARRDRRYWTIFAQAHGSVDAAFPGASTEGPCPFRTDWQQPMRNHALALGAAQAGRVDSWAVALVHHDDNPDVVEPWDAWRAAAADRAHLHRWPASEWVGVLDEVLPGEAVGAYLRRRYLLPGYPPSG